MKVLFLTDGIHPFALGGMQKHSLNLVKYLAKQGVEVTLAHCVYANKTIPKREEVAALLGISKENIFGFCFPLSPSFPGHYIFNSWRYSKLLWNQFKDHLKDFDVIYAQGFTAWAFLFFGKSSVLPPVVTNLHGLEMYQPSFSLKEKLQKLLLKIPANYIIKNTDFAQSLGGRLTPILLKFKSKEYVWECSIGIESGWLQTGDHSHRDNDNQSLAFAFIGRNEHRKGLHILHKALKRLANNQYDFTVDFIGPIEEGARLTGNNFRYHGTITKEEKIKAILDNTDILLVPSLAEGMPTVILEAMSRRLAIVATNVGAVTNLVNDTNGWILQKPEDIEALMEDLLTMSKETIAEKRANSLQKVNEYTWDKVVGLHMHFFEKIIKQRVVNKF